MPLQRAYCWGFVATALSTAVAGVAVLLVAELVHPPFPSAVQLGRLLFPPPRG